MKIHKTFSSGCGKFASTFQFVEEGPESKVKLYVISREEIESLNLNRFLNDFSPKNSKRELREISSQMHFVVEGYDQEAEELFEIPSVRNFFFFANMQLPVWSFASALTSPALWGVVLSLLPTMVVRREMDDVSVSINHEEVVKLFLHGLPAFRLLAKQAGLSKRKVGKNLYNVAAYLGIADQ